MLTLAIRIRDKHSDELEKDMVSLQTALVMTRKLGQKLQRQWWQSERAGRRIVSSLYTYKTEKGRRRAMECPAYGKWVQAGGYEYPQCNGRVGRPYTQLPEQLWHKLCSECKLPYDQIRTKAMILRMDGNSHFRRV